MFQDKYLFNFLRNKKQVPTLSSYYEEKKSNQENKKTEYLRTKKKKKFKKRWIQEECDE